MIDGFYHAYATGKAGNSVLVLVIRQGVIIGVDVGGLKYDGEIVQRPDGSYQCSVVYVVPPGANLITGAAAPSAPLRVPFTFTLPANFSDGSIFRLDSPLGPVNIRFEKVREL